MLSLYARNICWKILCIWMLPGLSLCNQFRNTGSWRSASCILIKHPLRDQLKYQTMGLMTYLYKMYTIPLPMTIAAICQITQVNILLGSTTLPHTVEGSSTDRIYYSFFRRMSSVGMSLLCWVRTLKSMEIPGPPKSFTNITILYYNARSLSLN